VGANSTLPWFPVGDKVSDTRYQWFIERFGQRCWEVDALPPPVLRARLDKAIAAELDLDAWQHAIAIEQAEVNSMQSILGNWKKSISGLDPKYSEGQA
jgi:hypothetical protein